MQQIVRVSIDFILCHFVWLSCDTNLVWWNMLELAHRLCTVPLQPTLYIPQSSWRPHPTTIRHNQWCNAVYWGHKMKMSLTLRCLAKVTFILRMFFYINWKYNIFSVLVVETQIMKNISGKFRQTNPYLLRLQWDLLFVFLSPNTTAFMGNYA